MEHDIAKLSLQFKCEIMMKHECIIDPHRTDPPLNHTHIVSSIPFIL